MPPPEGSLQAWWPTTQSLDLVDASAEVAAAAVQIELSRFASDQPAHVERRNSTDINDALGANTLFHNVPTTVIALPTRSRWTVLWYNGFLCDGYDSLCQSLTSRHFLTTMHWAAHDEWTTFQSGARFCFRRHDGHEVVQRRVDVAQTDRKWDFFESGVPIPEEDVAGYTVSKKRDRLNERRMMELLSRLGAEPWSEAFYALPGDTFIITRPSATTMLHRTREEVLSRPSSV